MGVGVVELFKNRHVNLLVKLIKTKMLIYFSRCGSLCLKSATKTFKNNNTPHCSGCGHTDVLGYCWRKCKAVHPHQRTITEGPLIKEDPSEELSFKPSLKEGYALGGEEKGQGSKWREAEAEQSWLGSQTHPLSSILKATRAGASNPSLTLPLCPLLPLPTFKDHHDYIGPTGKIQKNLPISRSSMWLITSTKSLRHVREHSQVWGIGTVDALGGHNSVHHHHHHPQSSPTMPLFPYLWHGFGNMVSTS